MHLFKKPLPPQKDANFFVYFPEGQKAAAEAFAQAHAKQFTVRLHLLVVGDRKEWSVKLNRSVSGFEQYRKVGDTLEAEATAAGGDYDGSEIQT